MRGERVPLRYAAVAMAAISWGTWPLILGAAGKMGPMPAALEAALVLSVMTVVSGIAVTRDRVSRRATLLEWLGLGWLGVADALNILLYFAALGATSVAVAVLTHYLTPILVALAAPLFLRERATGATWIAVGLSFTGLVLLLAPWNASKETGTWLGAALGAGSAFFYASNVLVNKRLVHAFSTSELIFYHGLVATPLLALVVPRAAWAAADPRAVALVAIAGIGPGALAGLFFVWGLRRIPAAHASTLALLEPLVAVVTGAVVLHQRLGPAAIGGAACILVGAATVASVRPHDREPALSPTP